MDPSSPNGGCVLESAELKRMIGEEALNVLKCGICWEFYVEPVVLSCGHTFCSRCLIEMANHARRNNFRWPIQNVYMGCPNCRRPVLASFVLAEKLPQNYPMASLLDSLRQQQLPKMVDQETNTDPPEPEMKECKGSDNNEEISRKRKTQYDYDEEQLDLITADLDVILRTLAPNGTILGDMSCVADIQQIVRDFHNSSPSSTQSDDGGSDGNTEDAEDGGTNFRVANSNRSTDQSTNIEPPTQPQQFPPNVAHQILQAAPGGNPVPVTKQPPLPTPSNRPQSFEDPAILSYSMGTRDEPNTAHAQRQQWAPLGSLGLYSFPGFGQM